MQAKAHFRTFRNYLRCNTWQRLSAEESAEVSQVARSAARLHSTMLNFALEQLGESYELFIL
jgi:hypothetical protein